MNFHLNFIYRALILGAFIITGVQCSSEKEKVQPDLILTNGKIITVNSEDQIVEAIAIQSDTIMALGTTNEIESLAGNDTRKIDLKRKTVTPGLLDSHIHFSSSPWNTPNVVDLNYPNAKSISEIKELIAEKVETVEPGEWVQGVGLDEGKLEEQRLITAEDLEEVSPENPVWLSHTTGHYGVANYTAMELAGIDNETSNPSEGIIERDNAGRATGILKESAMGLIYKELPPTTVEDIENGLSYMTQNLNKVGMTGIKDPTINPKRWEAYQRTLKSGKLNLRVFALWTGGKSLASAQNALKNQEKVPDSFSIGNHHLVAGGVKIFADGSGGARTAWLYDEWNKNRTEIDKGNYGFPNIQPDTLRSMIKTIHNAGIHASTHAIGDRTIDTVVTIYKEALEASPTKDLRHGLIHANIPTQYALDNIEELQKKYQAGYPEPSATFTWWIGDTYAGNFGERAKKLNPFATFKDRDILWANGSDYSVTPYPAHYGIWASIARKPEVGKYDDPFGDAESVDVETALKAATIWVAHQMFMEDKIGSLEIGKYADLAVWDRDLYTIPTSQIKNMQCLMTIFNGEIVFESGDIAK